MGSPSSSKSCMRNQVKPGHCATPFCGEFCASSYAPSRTDTGSFPLSVAMSVRRPGRLGAAQMTARFLIEQARALLLVDREFCQDFVRPRESWIFIEILSEEAGQVDEHADSRLRAEVPSRPLPHFPEQ